MVYEIVEVLKPYSKKYKTCWDEVLEEKRQNAKPELKEYLDDISGYEVIYIYRISNILWNNAYEYVYSA